MTKMVSLKKSAADRRTEKDALGETAAVVDESPEHEGIAVHLEHHHLMKLGVGGALKSGHKVELHGAGTVERSETRSTKDGERHSATIRLHKGAIEHEADRDEERDNLRSEIAKNTDAMEKQAKK